jgi:hypothetical protein
VKKKLFYFLLHNCEAQRASKSLKSTYQEVLFPPHKNIVSLFEGIIVEGVGIERLGILIKRQEFALKKREIAWVRTRI